MKRTVSIILSGTISAVFLILLFQSNTSSGVQSVQFDLSIADDATPAVLKIIQSASEQSISEITFEKGTYHFYPDRALESFRRISNHGDVLVFTAFPINDLHDLTIDGQGSTFIFHGRMIPFLVDESSKITIRNLSIDWADTFHSESTIVASNEVDKTFDIQISDQYPYEIRNEQLIFIKEYYEHELGQTILYDPVRKAIAFDTESYTPLTAFSATKYKGLGDKIKYKYKIDPRSPELRKIGREKKIRAVEIEPGLVRIHNHSKKMPPTGMILVAKGEQGTNRVAPALKLTDTQQFTAENVNVHHAGGMGLIAENSADIRLDSFNITPSHGRMVSTTADATHFVGCRGKIELVNCTFNNQLDDATNVHGSYQEIVEILDDHTIGVRMGHFQQQGFRIGNPGDTLGFVRLTESFFPYAHAIIKDVEKINGRYQIITLNEPLASSSAQSDFIENLSAYPEVLVQNCNISQNRARGLLISTPRKTTIDNNFFSTEMEAILIPVESSHWYESGNAANVSITNNTFQNCQHSGFDRGVIRLVTDEDNKNIAFKNIVIDNNRFNHFDNLILEAANTSNLRVTNNKITQTMTFPQLHPERPAFALKSSEQIHFENNQYQGKAKVLITTDETMATVKFD